MFNDKQRLDFLESKGCVEIEHEYLGPMRLLYNMDEVLGEGENLREAINAAMHASGVGSCDADQPTDAQAEAEQHDWHSTLARAAESMHPLDALLPEICQLIDRCKADWERQGCWSPWDQSVRNRITAYNLARNAGVPLCGKCSGTNLTTTAVDPNGLICRDCGFITYGVQTSGEVKPE